MRLWFFNLFRREQNLCCPLDGDGNNAIFKTVIFRLFFTFSCSSMPSNEQALGLAHCKVGDYKSYAVCFRVIASRTIVTEAATRTMRVVETVHDGSTWIIMEAVSPIYGRDFKRPLSLMQVFCRLKLSLQAIAPGLAGSQTLGAAR
jgi:hypothetical protein